LNKKICFCRTFAKNTIIETANLQQPGIIGAALLAKSIIEK